ncbi:hypothetical protein CLV82_1877 [Zeaxanthinibacter enoshimensis]|uniref:Pectate lyase n=2 Tax=Zeaxanthinibacter enoshimensis TaxID=392009 RepID=A0A4R6TNJ8_9FLAO|nr:hypothetical protein CLV82_1877 [Zeaxanthinibacter enoshimensis]
MSCLIISVLMSCSKDSDLLINSILNDQTKDLEEYSSASDKKEEDSGSSESEADLTHSDETDSQNYQDEAHIDYGPLKAFPSAYGAGAYTTGGRGGSVLHVTNLNDSGPGSLRAALNASGKRIIVFDVSGVIVNKTPLVVKNGDFTIAGQTAPEGGITITGERTEFSGCKNFIVRYIRIRPRFNTYNERDAVSIASCSDYIFDHLSTSWGTDEIISTSGGVNNATFQRILIAEGNKTGSIMGNSDDPSVSENFSMHNCLFYNISHRFPNVNSNGRVDVINNVVYNWNYRLIRTQGSVQLNHLNNFYLRQKNNAYTNQLNKVDYSYGGTKPQIYTAGNIIGLGIFEDPKADNWELWSTFNSWSYGGKSYRSDTPEPAPADFRAPNSYSLLGSPLPIKPAVEAYNNIVNDVGANKRLNEHGEVVIDQDVLDANYLSRVIGDNPQRYDYKSLTDITNSAHYINFFAGIASTPLNYGYTDTDQDGMPDAWEEARSYLDPNDPADGNLDFNNDGYTNLEDFLNQVDF